jgi:hypothetical protein
MAGAEFLPPAAHRRHRIAAVLTPHRHGVTSGLPKKKRFGLKSVPNRLIFDAQF